MKVLFCITRSDTIGGAHVHVADLAVWLRQQKHSVAVLVGGEGPYINILRERGVDVRTSEFLCRPIRPLTDFRAVVDLRRLFRSFAPDLVSLHSTKAGLLGRLAAIGLDIPVVFTAHGWSFTEGIGRGKRYSYRLVEKLVAPLATRIIAVSDYDRNLAIDNGVAHQSKVVTIRNAMPDISFLPRRPDAVKKVVLTMVARLDDQKDHDSLLRALAKLKNYDWELRLVGDGPRETSIRVLVHELGLHDRVQLLGLRTDVDRILTETDIFVLTSNWEGLPRSILEAMRAGIPVVASDVGGVKECFVDEKIGFLIPRGDTNQLIDCLRRLLTNPEERERFGRSARKSFERNFEFHRMARETYGLYQEILSGVK